MPILLAEVGSVAEQVDLSSLVTAITGSITPADIITILGSVIGVGMGFVLMWFGTRKVISLFSTALKSGKIKA